MCTQTSEPRVSATKSIELTIPKLPQVHVYNCAKPGRQPFKGNSRDEYNDESPLKDLQVKETKEKAPKSKAHWRPWFLRRGPRFRRIGFVWAKGHFSGVQIRLKWFSLHFHEHRLVTETWDKGLPPNVATSEHNANPDAMSSLFL